MTVDEARGHVMGMAAEVRAIHRRLRTLMEISEDPFYEMPEVYELHRLCDDLSNTAHYLYNPEYH